MTPKTKIANPKFDGTVKRGSATCPCCGYTTPVARVREQLKRRRGGASDARLFCVVSNHASEQGRFYRLPTDKDLKAVGAASRQLEKRGLAHKGKLSLVPDEKLDVRGIRHTWAMIYGLERWGDLFMPRQALVLSSLVSGSPRRHQEARRRLAVRRTTGLLGIGHRQTGQCSYTRSRDGTLLGKKLKGCSLARQSQSFGTMRRLTHSQARLAI